jgi:hypothetical protein
MEDIHVSLTDEEYNLLMDALEMFQKAYFPGPLAKKIEELSEKLAKADPNWRTK